MPFEPTFTVTPSKGGYVVMTTSMSGAEFPCTLVTPNKATAEAWCRKLRGAARVETERVNDIRAGRRQIDDA